MNEFKLMRLAAFTVTIVTFGFVSLIDDDISAFFLITAGFAYASALYFSLTSTFQIKKYLLGVFILGLCNVFVFYSSAILMLAPKYFAKYLFFMPPSILGAAITLFILWKVWLVKSVPRFSTLTFVLIAIISILSPLIIIKLEQSFRIEGFTGIVINSLLWCIAFTLSVVISQRRANKALGVDTNQ